MGTFWRRKTRAGNELKQNKRFKPDNTFLYLSLKLFFFIVLIYKILNGINNKYNY